MSTDAFAAFLGEEAAAELSANPNPRKSYMDSLVELDNFCDKEPQTLKHEPDYKPMPGAVNRFHKVIDVHYSRERRAVVFTVFRPGNPNTRSPKQEIKGLAIPDFLLAELGFGVPGEWKWKNDALNDGVEAAEELPDPFEELTDYSDIFEGGDPYAD